MFNRSNPYKFFASFSGPSSGSSSLASVTDSYSVTHAHTVSSSATRNIGVLIEADTDMTMITSFETMFLGNSSVYRVDVYERDDMLIGSKGTLIASSNPRAISGSYINKTVSIVDQAPMVSGKCYLFEYKLDAGGFGTSMDLRGKSGDYDRERLCLTDATDIKTIYTYGITYIVYGWS